MNPGDSEQLVNHKTKEAPSEMQVKAIPYTNDMACTLCARKRVCSCNMPRNAQEAIRRDCRAHVSGDAAKGGPLHHAEPVTPNKKGTVTPLIEGIVPCDACLQVRSQKPFGEAQELLQQLSAL